MPNEIAKVTINWTGFAGAPGFTNLFFNDFTEGNITQAIVDGALTRADNWVGGFQSRLPTTVKCQVQNTVQIINVPDGKLTRFMNGAAKTVRTGSGTGNYSAASGACVNWYTNGVRNARRVRGRTFIVPLAGSALDSDGSINNTELAAIKTNTDTLLAAGVNQGMLGVYARPSGPGATDGVWYSVSAYTIPDKVAVLRSRRD